MKHSLVALSLLAALPLAASASDLSYTYVEGGYAYADGGGDHGDGFALNGSFALGSMFHLFGGYDEVSANKSNIDVDTGHLGFGYNHSLSGSTDLVARVGVRENEAKINLTGGRIELDRKAHFTEVGVRSRMASNLEGYAYAGYERPEGGSGDYYGRLGGQYKFNPRWGLVADVKFGQGTEQYFLGPRLTF